MTEKIIKKRWWIAGLLSALSTGLGHFYAGKLRAGLFWLCAVILTPIAIITIFGGWRFGFLAAFVIQGAIWVAAITSAAIVAARSAPLNKSASLKIWHYAVFYLGALAFAVSASTALKHYGPYRIFQIPAGSMKPSVEVGDYIVVRKLSPKDKEYIKPGTIVVFKNEKDVDSLGNPKDYIKRIVALGGETITFKNGIPVIDANPLAQVEEGTIKIKTYYGELQDMKVLVESNRGHRYNIVDWQIGSGPLDNVGPYYIPDGNYFVLGDNRDQSQDSRVISAMGYVPEEQILGEAVYIAWNLNGLSRIGKKLD